MSGYTSRNAPYLLGTEFEDSQPAGSITPQSLRDFIGSVQSGTIFTTRVVTASGAITMLSSDSIIIVNMGTPSAVTVNLIANPVTNQQITIKDGAGNASTYNITITPNSGNIDGASSLVLNNNYASVDLVYNGTQWNVV